MTRRTLHPTIVLPLAFVRVINIRTYTQPGSSVEGVSTWRNQSDHVLRPRLAALSISVSRIAQQTPRRTKTEEERQSSSPAFARALAQGISRTSGFDAGRRVHRRRRHRQAAGQQRRRSPATRHRHADHEPRRRRSRGIADPRSPRHHHHWNGRNVFTASGRALALQDIPANLVRQIDVFKTRAAEQLETGLAGQIDVRTRRPFDLPASNSRSTRAPSSRNSATTSTRTSASSSPIIGTWATASSARCST